jgi:hypothetical protein
MDIMTKKTGLTDIPGDVRELEQFLDEIMAQNPDMTLDKAMDVVVDLVAKEIKNPGAKDS